jgi:hypothetical protein
MIDGHNRDKKATALLMRIVRTHLTQVLTLDTSQAALDVGDFVIQTLGVSRDKNSNLINLFDSRCLAL